MSITSICHICETAVADHECRRCGALVCTEHFVTTSGYCTDCAGGRMIEI